MLQPYDNIDSLLDKLDQVFQTTRGLTQIQVFWPARGRVLDSSLEFGMVAGWAERNRIRLAFISTDPQVMMKAAEHNIPVFESAEKISSAPVAPSERFLLKRSDSIRAIRFAKLKAESDALKEKKRPLMIELPLFLFALVAASLILFIVVPHASVKIQPEASTREFTLPLWTNASINTLTMNGGVPSEILRFSIEMKSEVPATGIITGAGSLAVGTVMLQNICDRDQRIPIRTNFSVSADQEGGFHSLSEINLPGQTETMIPVEANAPGESWNLSANSLSVVPTPLDQCIRIRQPEAMSGGEDGIFVTPTEEDYQAATEKNREQIGISAAEIVEEKAGAVRIPLMQTFAIEKLMAETLQPALGYAGETLGLVQTFEVSVRTVNRRDIAQQVQMFLDSNPQAGFSPKQETARFTVEENTKLAGTGQFGWDVHAVQSGEQTVNQEQIKELISGKTLRDAKQLLREQYALSDDPAIEVWPSWLDRLPLVASNIWFWRE